MAVGLILEGGGMRGIYTAGVLEYFLEKEIEIPYVVAVSAGACNATSYIAKQKKRNYTVIAKYINDPRYLSLRNLIRKGSIFDFEFVIDELGKVLEPLDFESFMSSQTRFITGATDIETAKPVYFEKEEYIESFDCLKASCSQPFVSKIMDYKGYKLLDGGLADPIPIQKSIQDGNDKHVIVLTREIGYTKKKEFTYTLCKQVYGEYPDLVELLMTRNEEYNRTLGLCHELEEEGLAVIIQPDAKLPAGRMERNRQKLAGTYRTGIHDAKKKAGAIRKLLQSEL